MSRTNKNDIIKIVGKPSTVSNLMNDVWIYIERENKHNLLKNLGRTKIQKNQCFRFRSLINTV